MRSIQQQRLKIAFIFLFACLLFILMLVLLHHRSLHPQPVIIIYPDQQSASRMRLQAVDFKQQLVKIISTGETSEAVEQMDDVLTRLADQAASYPMIAGIEIDAHRPLSTTAAEKLAVLAKKSIFVAAKFQFKQANDWQQIFAAEQQNPTLLTTIYGSTAVAQLMQTPSLGAQLAANGVVFSHLYTAASVTTAQANAFWQNFAATCKNTKVAHAVILLEAGVNKSSDMDTQMQAALQQGGGYLIWIGGPAKQHFVAANQSVKSLMVWRNVNNQTQGFLYNRQQSPEGLYSALGSNALSLSILEFLATRAQHAAQAGINLLGDAEDNIHTYAVLLALANTTIANGQRLLQPPPVKNVLHAKLTIILANPSAAVINQLLLSSTQLQESMVAQHYLGVFDFSTSDNKYFYDQLRLLLKNSAGVDMSYNSANAINLKQFLQASRGHKVREIHLGPDASLLYSEQDKNDVLDLIQEQTIRLYQQ